MHPQMHPSKLSCDCIKTGMMREAVDILEINTVLFLRPTDSLTVFLQQLGCSLRLSVNKECLTVLDFIGQANRKYNFEDKFDALLSKTTNSFRREIKDGFAALPKSCYIQLSALEHYMEPSPSDSSEIFEEDK